jgi:hypothetical protein
MSNIDFDDISMSTSSTSGYSVDIKEEPIETNNSVFISKPGKRFIL